MEEREEGMGCRMRGVSPQSGGGRSGGISCCCCCCRAALSSHVWSCFGGIGRAVLDSFAPLWPFVDKAEVKRRCVTAPSARP